MQSVGGFFTKIAATVLCFLFVSTSAMADSLAKFEVTCSAPAAKGGSSYKSDGWGIITADGLSIFRQYYSRNHKQAGFVSLIGKFKKGKLVIKGSGYWIERQGNYPFYFSTEAETFEQALAGTIRGRESSGEWQRKCEINKVTELVPVSGLSGAKRKLESLQSRLSGALDQLAAKDEELKKINSQLSELEAGLSKTKQALIESENRLSDQKKKLTDEKEQLKGQIAELTIQLEEKTQSLGNGQAEQELKKQITALEKDKAELADEFAKAQEAFKKEKNQFLAQLSKLNKQVVDATEADKNRQPNQGLASQIASLEQDKTELTNELELAKIKISELELITTNSTSAPSQALEAENQRLQDALASLNRQLGDVNRAANNLDQIKRENIMLADSLENAEAEAKDLVSENTELQAKLDVASQAASAARQDLQTAQNRNTALERQIAEVASSGAADLGNLRSQCSAQIRQADETNKLLRNKLDEATEVCAAAADLSYPLQQKTSMIEQITSSTKSFFIHVGSTLAAGFVYILEKLISIVISTVKAPLELF